ncbi:MAG: VOC family protein [Bacteroidota bacterium]
MLTAVSPKLPMRNQAITQAYYCQQLGFETSGNTDYDGYLMVQKDQIELHFFAFKDLDPKENYGQIYIRTDEIERFYQELVEKGVAIHPAGKLTRKPWGQQEFSLLDPDNNLLTFGQEG